VAICVLTVRDDELGVRDNKDTLLDIAKGGACAGKLREIMWMGLDTERNT
jgi:hypothetical protein